MTRCVGVLALMVSEVDSRIGEEEYIKTGASTCPSVAGSGGGRCDGRMYMDVSFLCIVYLENFHFVQHVLVSIACSSRQSRYRESSCGPITECRFSADLRTCM